MNPHIGLLYARRFVYQLGALIEAEVWKEAANQPAICQGNYGNSLCRLE